MNGILRIVLALGALLTLSSAAMAGTIVGSTASADLGGTLFLDSDSGSTVVSALVADGEYRGQGGATVAGQLGTTASFFGASGTFAKVTGSASWTKTFDAAAGSTATFDFFIPEAAIGFISNNVPGLIGSYNVDIVFNGASIFDALGEVQLTGSFPVDPIDFSLDQQGTILSATFADDILIDDEIGRGYRFGAFSGRLNLSPVAGVNTIEYSMTTMVDGLIGETGALASIGDPLNLAQQPAGANLTVNGGDSPVVPEPSTLVIMLLGGLVMLLYRNRYFDKTNYRGPSLDPTTIEPSQTSALV